MGYTAAWSPDGKQLCSANSSGAATLWDAETGKSLKTFVTSGTELLWNQAVQASESSDGAGGNPGLLLARGTTGVVAWQPAAASHFSHTLARILPPTWTPNKPIVRGVGTPTLSIWDSSTAKKLSTLQGHTAAVSAVAWTRDGRTLATASHDATVRLWDPASGKLLHTLKDHNRPVYCVAWSPDGKTRPRAEPTTPSGCGTFWASRWARSAEDTRGPFRVAWSPRGNLLASGSSDTKVCLWQPEKQHMQLLINAGQPVLSLSFNPDGSVLAGGVATLSLRFGSPPTGSC